jgi:O-antigen ligase/polysaccharide polymerase Wzy-like membrane protein
MVGEDELSSVLSVRERANPWKGNRLEKGLVLVFATIALVFIPLKPLGFYMSGWAWLLELAVLAPLVLIGPVHVRAARYLAPYIVFLILACATLAWTWSIYEGLATLAQFIVPAIGYLIAWRVRTFEIWKLSTTSLYVLAITVIVVFAFIPAAGFSQRPAAISLVVLFAIATINSRSWRYTMLIGAIGLGVTLSTGSRIASAVMMIVLLTSPSLNLRWGGRIVIGLLCAVLVYQITQTQQFKERFFFNEDASLLDVVTLSNDVNTSGRRELWPLLQQECSKASIIGLGLGTSSPLSAALSHNVLGHPHNDYLRMYCDVGLAGSVPFWSFFLWACIRSWRGAQIGVERRLHAVAGQLMVVLFLFAITDNLLLYTAQFMVPSAVILGLSDSRLSRAPRPKPRQPRSRQPALAASGRSG